MSSSLTCDQCGGEFDSNFRLYRHKVQAHGPTLAIVTNGSEPGEPGDRQITVDGRVAAAKRARKDSEGDDHPSKFQRLNDKQGVKRKFEDNSAYEQGANKIRKLNGLACL